MRGEGRGVAVEGASLVSSALFCLDLPCSVLFCPTPCSSRKRKTHRFTHSVTQKSSARSGRPSKQWQPSRAAALASAGR